MPDAPTIAEVVNESASDSIRAVMSEMEDKNADAPGTSTNDAQVSDGSVGSGPDVEGSASAAGTKDSDTGTEGGATGQLRDEHGRFVAQQKEGEGTEAAVVEGEAQAEVEDDLEPPPEWTAEEQDQFRALAPEARRIVLGRVTAAQEQQQAAEALKARYGGLEQLIAPRKQFWERDGLDEVGGVRQLLALSDFAAQDAPGFIRWFAQQRGLNPYQVWQLQQQAGEQPGQFEYVDPEVQALQGRLDRFEQYLQNQQQQQQAQSAQAVQAEYAQVRNELSEFATAKDDKGRSKRPHFDEVRTLMGSFFGSGQAPDLATAYDMACRAHPGVYAKIESQRKAQAAQEQAKQQREKAATARQAGSSVSGTPGDRAKPEPSGDLREDLRREFQERGMLRA